MMDKYFKYEEYKHLDKEGAYYNLALLIKTCEDMDYFLRQGFVQRKLVRHLIDTMHECNNIYFEAAQDIIKFHKITFNGFFEFLKVYEECEKRDYKKYCEEECIS